MVIFSDYGITIEKTDDKLFLIYDAGEIVEKIAKIEITEADARQAQLNEMNAYNVILKYQTN